MYVALSFELTPEWEILPVVPAFDLYLAVNGQVEYYFHSIDTPEIGGRLVAFGTVTTNLVYISKETSQNWLTGNRGY